MALTNLTRVYENTCPATGSGILRLRGAAQVQDGDLIVKPILVSEGSVFGAEISGIDWSQPLSKDRVQQVRSITIAARTDH